MGALVNCCPLAQGQSSSAAASPPQVKVLEEDGVEVLEEDVVGDGQPLLVRRQRRDGLDGFVGEDQQRHRLEPVHLLGDLRLRQEFQEGTVLGLVGENLRHVEDCQHRQEEGEQDLGNHRG